MDRYNAILQALKDMSDSDLVAIHNEYCEKCNYYDDRIYYMQEFDDLFCGCSPLEIVDRIDTNFNSNDDYFKFNGYGYAESLSYPEFHIEEEDIATYIDDNEDSLYNSDIQNILDDFEEEDEEDTE